MPRSSRKHTPCLTATDIDNAMELSLHVWADPDPVAVSIRWSAAPNPKRPWSAIVDAEGEIVALVNPEDARTMCELLSWAADNYPYLISGDDDEVTVASAT